MRRLLDPRYANWDQSRYPTLKSFLCSVMNGVAANRRKRKGRPVELPSEDDVLSTDASSSVSQEKRVLDASELRQRIDFILARLDGDELLGKLLYGILDGIDEPAEQATTLGVPIDRVYKLRARLRALGEEASASLEANERGARKE